MSLTTQYNVSPRAFRKPNELMNLRPRRALEDFPKFTVSQLICVGTDPQGDRTFELKGRFDRLIEPIGDISWFWLLTRDRAAVCVQWKTVGPGTAATLVADEKEMPEMTGKTFYYLSPAWDPRHIWMVLDERHAWKREPFQASDVVAETIRSTGASIVGGREVKTWTRFSQANIDESTEQCPPTLDDTSVSDVAPQRVPGGWDHEHCELCREHIAPGNFGYRDRENHWLCEHCYNKYMEPRDLSFVDDL